MNLRVFSVLLVLTARAFSAGFTEPPIIFYGKVTQDFDGYSIDLSRGELSFTVQPTGGTPLSFTTSLEAIGGGYSYRLKIPVEKVPSGFTVTDGSIKAPTTSTSFTRAATLDGNTVTISLPASPAGGAFSFAENQRGKIQRVDLSLTTAFEDTDGDGLPDWWELLHGLDPTDGFDTTADPDGDTADALTEYRQHTDPTTYEFDYRRWAAQHALVGPEFPMNADIDFDGVPNGIEFALDTDPRTPDAGLAQSRMPAGVQQFSGNPYFTFAIAKPALRRTQTNYVIEATSDFATWGAVEGTDAITLENTTQNLRVRSVLPITSPAASARRYFRLKIQDAP